MVGERTPTISAIKKENITFLLVFLSLFKKSYYLGAKGLADTERKGLSVVEDLAAGVAGNLDP